MNQIKNAAQVLDMETYRRMVDGDPVALRCKHDLTALVYGVGDSGWRVVTTRSEGEQLDYEAHLLADLTNVLCLLMVETADAETWTAVHELGPEPYSPAFMRWLRHTAWVR